MKYKEIKLRALEPEDLELLYEWENNESYWTISSTISPFSKYTLKRYLENSHKNIYARARSLLARVVPEPLSRVFRRIQNAQEHFAGGLQATSRMAATETCSRTLSELNALIEATFCSIFSRAMPPPLRKSGVI